MSDEDRDFEREFQAARDDHYLHLAAVAGAGAYAWQLHGIWVAILTTILVLVAITITNALIMAHWAQQDQPSELPSRRLRMSRWGWVIAAFAALALSGASVASLP